MLVSSDPDIQVPTSNGDTVLDSFGIRTTDGFATSPLSVRVQRGETTLIVGVANTGKSLIFEHLAGIRRPGIARVGRVEGPLPEFVPQDPRLAALPTDSVWTVLGLSRVKLPVRRVLGWDGSGSAAEERAHALLARLRLRPDRIFALPFRSLSSSERRRVLLAASLLKNPELLLIDAWDEFCDPQDRRAIAAILSERQKEGLRLLVTTRRFPPADLRFDRALELANVKDAFEAAVPLVKKEHQRKQHDAPLVSVERLSVSRKTFHWGPRRTTAYPLDGASLYLRHGETLVVLGSSNCGKTTLLHAIAGLQMPNAGTVFLTRHDVTFAQGSRARRLRQDVQLVFQDAPSVLDAARTVREHLLEAKRLTEKKVQDIVPWLNIVGLSDKLLDVRADQLSASESQRVDLARSLILGPRVILFDSPEVSAAATDGGTIAAALAALKQEDHSFLVATGDAELARALADRVAIMHAGRIIEIGTRREVLDHPAHPLTRALLSGGEYAPTNPATPARGCPHVGLCPRRILPLCDEKEPMLAPLPRLQALGGNIPHGARRAACFAPIESDNTLDGKAQNKSDQLD